jgi:hypothetical protein
VRELLMSNTVLLVFEGETIEKQIFNSIETNFFPPSVGKTIIRASFRGEIFQLWNIVKDDPDLDIVEILKERPNSDIMDIDRKAVSEVHLFFDHDAHSHFDEISQQEYHEKINSLLDTFNNEFAMGKLWISYPMAEAIKHCKMNPMDCFNDSLVKILENTDYKKLVNDKSDYRDIRRFDVSIWHYLSAVNIQRTFCLVNDTYKAVSDYQEIAGWFEKNAAIVKMVHEKQYVKFINPKNGVIVLSPFPLFLLYYFGKPFFDRCKCDKLIKNCSFCCYQ